MLASVVCWPEPASSDSSTSTGCGGHQSLPYCSPRRFCTAHRSCELCVSLACSARRVCRRHGRAPQSTPSTADMRGENRNVESHPAPMIDQALTENGFPVLTRAELILAAEVPLDHVTWVLFHLFKVWKMPGDKRMLRGLNEVPYATKRVVRSRDTMLVECTGVYIECADPNDASFLTSLSLCSSSDGKSMVRDNFRIEVRFPNGVLDGQLVYYDSYYGIAVVSTQHVAVCEGYRRLVLDHDEALKSSSEAGIGGPLIDIEGNFVGMNYCSQMGDHSQKAITPCLPRNLILKCMEHSGIFRLETKQEGHGTIGSSTDTRDISKSSTHGNFYQEGFFKMNLDHEIYVRETAKSYGYPLPDLLQANMYMVNTFEENFIKDTWIKLGKDVASKMCESVVPLASFNGNASFFACTGVFIGNSKSFQTILTSASLVRITGNDSMRHNNLQIEVHLLNKRRARGKLTYCNFDYNIALVNIDETMPPPTIELQRPPVTTGTSVRAVGCVFDKCRLMATNGKVTGKFGTSDCNEHQISTCNITKLLYVEASFNVLVGLRMPCLLSAVLKKRDQDNTGYARDDSSSGDESSSLNANKSLGHNYMSQDESYSGNVHANDDNDDYDSDDQSYAKSGTQNSCAARKPSPFEELRRPASRRRSRSFGAARKPSPLPGSAAAEGPFILRDPCASPTASITADLLRPRSSG
ncbi:DNA repair protein rhp54 [Hordeum vulgare]|nr:DNA repair protein rhp54 [Hordeum vulgare]